MRKKDKNIIGPFKRNNSLNKLINNKDNNRNKIDNTINNSSINIMKIFKNNLKRDSRTMILLIFKPKTKETRI